MKRIEPNNEQQLKPDTVEDIELDLFIQAMFRFHGYDFRQYARQSLKRRVKSIIEKRSLSNISALIPVLAHDPECRTDIVNSLTVNYSKLFRDPFVNTAIKQEIFPYLASFPRLNVWIAGCAEGEEAYSLAIMLDEENLLDRSQIYATDISEKALDKAASGILTQKLDAETATRYQQSAGQHSLSDYFVSAYGKQKLKQQYLSKIHFQKHNLVQQPGFISAELILCRNVLIYFDRTLQHQVLSTMLPSLIDKGYLVIGTQENIDFYDQGLKLHPIDEKAGIYQK